MSAAPSPAHTLYWDSVASGGKVPSGHEFLRAYSDLIARDLLDRWWQPEQKFIALKTDLYDENWSSAVFSRLSDLNGVAAGSDLSPGVARKAGKLLGSGMLSVADVRSLPFASGSLDRILSLSTIDHFEDESDIHASLAEFHRVLRPGGEMILTMDNAANPVVWLRNALPFEFLHRIGLVPYFVGKTLRPGTLRLALREAGFEVRECTAAMHFPRVAALAAHRFARSPVSRQRWLSWIMSFEAMGRLPCRFLTGYFTAVLAVKPKE